MKVEKEEGNISLLRSVFNGLSISNKKNNAILFEQEHIKINKLSDKELSGLITKDEQIELNKLRALIRMKYLQKLKELKQKNHNKLDKQYSRINSIYNINKKDYKNDCQKTLVEIDSEIFALEKFPCYPLSLCGNLHMKQKLFENSLMRENKLDYDKYHMTPIEKAIFEASKHLEDNDKYRYLNELSPIIMLIVKHFLGIEMDVKEKQITDKVCSYFKSKDIWSKHKYNIDYNYMDLLQEAEGYISRVQDYSENFTNYLNAKEQKTQKIFDHYKNTVVFDFDIKSPGVLIINHISNREVFSESFHI